MCVRRVVAQGQLSGARIAARLHSSVDARTGRLPLRYQTAHAHYFDPESGARID